MNENTDCNCTDCEDCTDTPKSEDIVKRAKKRYELSRDTWASAREAALEDIKFSRLGEQWPDGVKRSRELEDRPCLTFNLLPAYLRQVVNEARQNSPSIKIHPVDSFADPDTAEIINGIIRNIESSSDAEAAYDNAGEDAVTCGWGFFRVDLDYNNDDSFDMDINISPIMNPNSVYFDHNSTAIDSSDWDYCFIDDSLDNESFKEQYPSAEQLSWDADSSDNDWFTEDTVRVVEYWCRKEEETTLLQLSNGIDTITIYSEQLEANPEAFVDYQVVNERSTKRQTVTQYILNGNEVLETTEWPGKFIPIIPVYGDEVDVEDRRYFLSLTRGAMDAQRNYNYWRSASTELVALAPKSPFIGEEGAFDADPEKWETANTQNHPYIEFTAGKQPPQRQPFAGPPAGALQEAANASNDIKQVLGMHDAGMGASTREIAGTAILQKRKESDTSTFHFIDNLSRGIRHCGRIVLDLIPHVYNVPRVMRVIGYDKTQESVQINQEFDKNGTTKFYDLTMGKYDLVVKTGASYSTKREEASTQMMELLRVFPQAAQLIGDLVAQNLDWPGADEISKRLKVMLPPAIIAMDKMENIDPEAQAIISNMKQQLDETKKLIEQGKTLLQQKDNEITSLILESQAKDKELKVKDADSQRKYDAAMTKVQSEFALQDRKFVADKEIIILKETFEKALDDMQIKIAAGNENKKIIIQTPSGATYTAITASDLAE